MVVKIRPRQTTGHEEHGTVNMDFFEYRESLSEAISHKANLAKLNKELKKISDTIFKLKMPRDAEKYKLLDKKQNALIKSISREEKLVAKEEKKEKALAAKKKSSRKTSPPPGSGMSDSEWNKYLTKMKKNKPKTKSQKGEDYSTDFAFDDDIKGGMITKTMISDLNKITKASVAKMTTQQIKKLEDDMDHDFDLLDDIESGYEGELRMQKTWLNNPDSIKGMTRNLISGLKSTLKDIERHRKLISKVSKYL